MQGAEDRHSPHFRFLAQTGQEAHLPPVPEEQGKVQCNDQWTRSGLTFSLAEGLGRAMTRFTWIAKLKPIVALVFSDYLSYLGRAGMAQELASKRHLLARCSNWRSLECSRASWHWRRLRRFTKRTGVVRATIECAKRARYHEDRGQQALLDSGMHRAPTPDPWMLQISFVFGMHRSHLRRQAATAVAAT